MFMPIMMRYILFILVSVAPYVSCKTGSGNTGTKETPSDEFSTATNLMELYDSSFRSLFYRHVAKSGEAFEQLALMYKLYTEYSIWVRVDTEGRMVSISKGKSNLLLAAYEPRHPYLTAPGPTLVTNGDQSIAIHFRPDRISKDFAGIFLVHELSHALDLLNHTRVDSPDINETKAYLHEKRAANIAYDKALDRGLDKVLAKVRPKDVTDLIRLQDSKEGRLRMQELLIGIEKEMVIAPPASEAEAEMRLGFYHVALEIRRQELQAGSKDSYSISAEKIGQLLRSSSKY